MAAARVADAGASVCGVVVPDEACCLLAFLLVRSLMCLSLCRFLCAFLPLSAPGAGWLGEEAAR